MIICIVGPTGVGKTKMSIELAKKFNGEVINADSTQVFKSLDIATAKVTEKEKEGIPHHLFDIKNIDEDYTVFDYQKDARVIIDDIISRGKTPIIVGGTGLYIKALLYDYKFEEESNNLNNYDNIDTKELYERLIKIDPKSNIHINNRKRIVRALNYYEANNKPMSEKEKTDKLLYNVKFIGLTTDRTTLYDRINKRVDLMIDNGLFNEVSNLKDKYKNSRILNSAIGYKEFYNYFYNNKSKEEVINEIKRNSRRFAKRQYTFFKHQFNTTWFEVDFNNFNNTVNEVYNYLKKQP